MALVPDIVIEIGAVAGIGAFLGISVLTVLLLIQARDVRRLREWAGRAPERDAEAQAAAVTAVTERAEEARATVGYGAGAGSGDGESGTGELPHGDPFEAEARATELRASRGRGGSGTARLGLTRVAQVGIVAVVLLLAGGGTYLAVSELGGGEEEPRRAGQRGQERQGGGGQERPASLLDPGQLQVAVLNGTDTSGLASSFQDGVTGAGYELGIVGNSQSTYDRSRVMHTGGLKPEAQVLARELEIRRVEEMEEEVTAVVEGAPLAVVLGDDAVPTG